MKLNWKTLFLLTTCCTLGLMTSVRAQITPDNSLGAESSTLGQPNQAINGIPINQIDQINGGARRQGNLFHSFGEFNVNAGRAAYFANPDGVTNILTRVTGVNRSNILGTLGVLGNANLFLINPNGIFFGPNARLDVGGSFFGSTANSLIFDNGFEFSATNPQAPLLTVNIPIGLRFRDNPGNITNQSVVQNNTGFIVGLQVNPGKSLALVGGNVSLEQGGSLTAAGGRIELGGLAGAGTVGLDTTGNTFKLNFPINNLSNVSLADDARVAVRSNGGGDIAVNANIFTATNGGRLAGGIQGMATRNGGNITVNSNDISFDGVSSDGSNSGIFSQVQGNAVGNANAGGIDITTKNLSLTNGAQISASTFGQGNAGNVKIQASDISLDGVGSDGGSSGIFSTVQGNGVNPGGIDITTGTLSLFNGAQINASTFATGDAGRIKIQASDSITASGVGSNDVASSIRSRVLDNATGNAGGIDITTKNLSFTNGAEITASTLGRGDAGSVKIQASDISFDGVSSNGFTSGIFSNVEGDAVGNAGGIDITTQTLFLKNGASLTASTFNEGNAGSVKIQASDISLNGVGSNGRSSAIFSSVAENGRGNADGIDIITGKLSLLDGAQISASTFGRGDAGIVKIQASDISLNGVGSNGRSSGIFSTVQGNSVNPGGIDITTGTLSLFNGAQINASTFATGDAGRIKIQASDSITASGVGSNDVASSIRSRVQPGATGNAGGIDITTKNLSFSNGAQITASTLGTGDAGSVKIQASDISFDGVSNGFTSGIFSNVEGDAVGNAGGINISTKTLSLTNRAFISASTFSEGNGGGIDISTGTLSLFNGAQIGASTFGQGNAGTVKIQASDISFDGVGSTEFSSGIFSNVQGNAVGNAGGIDITTQTLSLFNGAIINASTFATGDAGTVKIQASDSITASGVGSNDVASSIRSNVEDNATGNAGGIDITTKNLSFTNGAQITASTLGTGDAGSVKIQASDISFDGVSSNGFTSGIFSNVEGDAVGNAGGIDITTKTLSLFNGAQITASTFNEGNAGTVKIQASDIFVDGVGRTESSSGIFSAVATNGRGNAGGIDITTGTLSLFNGAIINASTFGTGDAGTVKIQASDSIKASGVGSNDVASSIRSNVENNATGNAGGIDISTKNLFFTNGAQIAATTLNRGNAGSVKIQASDISFDGVGRTGFSTGIFSNVEGVAVGNAGGIDITTGTLSLTNGAVLTASTSGNGNAGNVTINASDRVSFAGLGSNNFGSGVYSLVASGASGNGGDVNIKAGSLSINDFGFIGNNTYGQGNAGKVSVRVDDAIALGNSSEIRSNVERGGSGIGGDIDIRARSLTLTGGSQISATVFREGNGLSGGKGRAGNIEINATDFVNIFGVGTAGFSSGLFAGAERGTTAISPQAAGNINLTTGNFRIADGAVVNALTSNSGAAGNITINANTFTANSGGQVITTTRSSGSAGNINLNIRDRITISGSDPNYNQRVSQAAQFGSPEDIVNNQGAASGIFANTALNSTGKGGNITIQPRQNSRPRIAIADGGEVRVDSLGQGVGGEISIRGNSLTLDRGTINASTTSANGGNIDLSLRNFLRLQNESLISANAGGQQGGGNGGNITIDTPFIVAFPRNNDITANAGSGSGGQVKINATLFGIAPLSAADLRRLRPNDLDPRQLPTSDITAISRDNPSLSGNVQVNSPDVDPSRGLVELPETVTDPTQRIAQNPCQQGVGNEFVVTGRGGFPFNPNQTLSSDNVRVDLLQPVASSGNSRAAIKPATNPTATRIPAQGWIFNDKGQVVLTAYDPTDTGSQRPWRTAAACPAR